MTLLKPLSIVTRMSKRKLSAYKEFGKKLSESRNIIAITGAGISAESGIPTFRGAGGFWRTHRSADLASPYTFRVNPGLVWEFYQYRRDIAFKAVPNEAHKALAAYEQICKDRGHQFTIITQNVDGLHQRAGSKEVIELHGALHKVICTKCKTIEENYDNPICEALRGRGDPDKSNENLPVIDKETLPRCKKCGVLLRPYIVWFGENLDEQVLQQTRELVESCDMCLVIGTSSVVYPAAMFAPLVAQRGKPVAEFNLNDEPANDQFQFHFPGKCGITLPKALGI